ncbi:MAG: hypothetical protein Q9162_003732 [Coniocarpon cinnabarinum]
MRQSVRIALACLITFTVISIIVISSAPQRFQEHLQDIKTFHPSIKWPSSSKAKTSDLLYDALKGDKHAPPPRPPNPNIHENIPRPPNDYSSFKVSNGTAPEKALVMARLSSENTSWVSELPTWLPYVYTVDDPLADLHTPKNKGREALAYLTYIIENYENLAKTVAFIHSHKDGYPQAWHTDDNDYSNVNALRRLKTDYVQEQGFVNLRCVTDIGCPAEIRPYRFTRDDTPPDPEKEAVELAFLEAYPLFFPELEKAPETIASACCAQVAASSAQIRKRPKVDYERIRDWILETGLSDDQAGRVMEYSWHVMFGKDAVFCPHMAECWCKVYGECFDVW